MKFNLPNKKRVVFFLCTIVNIGFIRTQTINVNPLPQKLNITDSRSTPVQFSIQLISNDEATKNLISRHFPNASTSNEGFQIRVGNVNNRFQEEAIRKVPSQAEGYYIKITPKGIIVIGRDDPGTFYGTQTLIALLKAPRLLIGEISDYPDVSSRGVVEGFYGTPWSFDHRMRQITFYGANKLNTYIYGPKDDPYHSSPSWRDPYPSKEASEIKKLVEHAHLNHVEFVWAIHPGKDIKWIEKDRKALLKKFEGMYNLGVRSFAVFFDDISGIGTDAIQQAELLNYLHDKFVTRNEGVKSLIMCPTEYNKSWADPKKGYLEKLGKNLNPSIRIMWTGNRVVSDIDKPTMEWINSKIQRKAFVWWNYPVSDYVRNHLLLGPAYGNDTEIADLLSGFVSNPMEHAEASKIALYGVADYAWNMDGYVPTTNWNKALKSIMPESYKALKLFASHNSDLGPNGHGYRKKESVDFSPQARLFLKNLGTNDKSSSINEVENEFRAMIRAAKILLDSKDNPFLLDEIRPWVMQFHLLGKAGLSIIHMQKSLQAGNSEGFEYYYDEVLSFKKQMFQIDHQENQNPYQPGIKTGSLVLAPLVEKSFSILTKTYNEKFNETLKIDPNYNPHKLFTNIPELEHQQILLKKQVLSLNPPLEYISFKPQAYVGFKLDNIQKLREIEYKIEAPEGNKNLSLEISRNGEDWTLLNPKKTTDNGKKISLNQPVKYIRISNNTSEENETKVKYFKATFN